MKKLIFTLSLFVSVCLNAQDFYSFSVSQETYQDLENSTDALDGEIWDDPNAIIPIGFSMPFYNNTFDTIFFFDDFLGATILLDVENEISLDYIILPFEADLIDKGALADVQAESPISYVVEGSDGNRIFKMEWKNAGFYEELFGPTPSNNDFVNIQLWLHEASGVIEFRHGPSMITNTTLNYEGNMGPLTGLADLGSYGQALAITGDSENPTIIENDITSTLSSTPPDGTVYRFEPIATNLANIDKLDLQIYPNPSSNQIHLLGQWQHINIYDIAGNLVKTFNTPQNNINIQTLPIGVYTIKAQNADGEIAVGQLLKK